MFVFGLLVLFPFGFRVLGPLGVKILGFLQGVVLCCLFLLRVQGFRVLGFRV